MSERTWLSCDDASWPYRARVEFWWWLEQRTNGIYEWRARRYGERSLDADGAAPAWLEYVGAVTYKHRKRAERMALRSLGELEPPESRFPRPWAFR